MSNELEQFEQADFLFYTDPEGELRLEVLYADESVWLTQAKMAALFGVEVQTVNYHLKEIFSSRELSEKSVIRKIRITASDGKNYLTGFYNLDAIISIGYRVNSQQATRFRQWATGTLREFLIKGFVLDDQRLKNGTHFGKDYFEELLERIREIRASERRVHLKLTDIFELASDYDSKAELTKVFFAFVQNKLHFAVTGKTAAEIISSRADSAKNNMGLTSWKQSPRGRIMKSDVTIAKNYLSENELRDLERAVVSFLDIAETRARRRSVLTMRDWLSIMDGYLDLSDYPKLAGSGGVSREVADKKAAAEFAKYRLDQDRKFENDFERATKKITDEKRKK